MEDILEDEAQDRYRVTAGELRQFVERYERLEAEKRDVADQMKEVMAEAKARGYDARVLRKLIALRKRDSSEVSEEEAILELYKQALGMCPPAGIRARSCARIAAGLPQRAFVNENALDSSRPHAKSPGARARTRRTGAAHA